MVRISPETVKEAASSVNDLMESASPEIRMLLENPNFATGLCLVLHREITELRQQLEAIRGGQGAAGPSQDDTQVNGRNMAPVRQETAMSKQAKRQSEVGNALDGHPEEQQGERGNAVPPVAPANVNLAVMRGMHSERRLSSQETNLRGDSSGQSSDNPFETGEARAEQVL